MIFKTEAERDEALEAIVTDPPPGVKIDEFTEKTEKDIDAIMKAEIIPEGQPAPDPVSEVQPTIQPVVEPEVPTQAAPILKEDSELQRLENNNFYLQQQNATQARENERKMAEFQRQIEELKTQGPKKEVPPERTEVDHEIIAVKDEISQLEKEMNGEEYDFDAEQALKVTKKTSQLQLKLMNLNQKKQDDLTKRQTAQMKKMEAKHRLEQKNKDDEEADKLKNKEIDSFSQSIPELKMSKSYSKMDIEYGNFAREVAALYYNTSANSVQNKDMEVAMQSYLEGNPILNQSLQKRGIKEPAEIRKFVLLSEVDALQQGAVLDKLTGEFVNFTDSAGRKVTFPSYGAAYQYLQNERGQSGKDIITAQKKTADNMMHAITRKSDPVELSSEHQREADIDDMTKEKAEEILIRFTTDEVMMKARKNFDDPLVRVYNKALAKTGNAVLDRKDLV